MKSFIYFTYLIISLIGFDTVNAKIADFVTVGDDSACDYNNGDTRIQDAINSGASEVRIASNTTYIEKILLENISVAVRGGFVDCAAAEQNQQTGVKTTINGGTGLTGPVVKITGNQKPHLIHLENLEVTGGSSNNPFLPGGGIVITESMSQIQLDNLLIHSNNSSSGGGILINDENVNLHIHNTSIENNTAYSGGGLACIGMNSNIKLTGQSKVSDNSAIIGPFSGGDGGGVFLTQGCIFSIRAGSAIDGSDLNDVISIHNNHAQVNGGGISVFNQARLQIDAMGHQPIFIRENTAEIDGGGISASEKNTTVQIAGAALIQNSGKFSGGIHLFNHAFLLLSDNLSNGKDCYIQSFSDLFIEPMGCNYFIGNAARGTGAIKNHAATALVYRTFFTANTANHSAAISTSSGATTSVESSVFAHNGLGGSGKQGYEDRFLISTAFNVNFKMINSTLVDNDVVDSVLLFAHSPDNEVSVTSSIIHNEAENNVPVLLAPNGQGAFDCVLVHEGVSLLGIESTRIQINGSDLGFVDRMHGDYHLSIDSPAIDFCGKNPSSFFGLDIDAQAFGWDDPNTINSHGPYDIGADEFVLPDDVIFNNGFDDPF